MRFVPHYTVSYHGKFYRAGILTGSDAKGTFKPTSSIKRSEVAAILSRMYNENVRQAITLK